MGWLAAAKKIFLTVALAANYEVAPPGIDAAKFPAVTRLSPPPRVSPTPSPTTPDFGEQLDGARAKGLDNAKLAAFPRYRALVETLERDLKELAPQARFPREWLRSRYARIRFVGRVTRPDRRPFTPDGCGETREIFRLFNSRMALPMTINLVYVAPRPPGDPRCESPTQPVARPPVRIELNMQYAHRPAATAASSLLRVFVFDGDRLISAPLENTPKSDKTARDRLLAFLKRPENIRRLDEGTLILPREFLAERATLPGRPFSQLFSAEDFVAEALPSRRYVTTPARYLRRLDELSCQGCHSTRSIAGFHYLGTDDELFHAASPHGRDVKPMENPPFVARPISGKGHYGDLCVYDDWTCGEGLECREGECVGRRGAVGEACPCVGTAACRTVADGFPGTACVGRGTFQLCLGERHAKTARACTDVALKECSAAEGCRSEYVCVRAPGGRGVCVPPLLLPPLNISAHAEDDPAL